MRTAGASFQRGRGFTLVELVIVLGILVMVLTVTYRLILDCLDAERVIDKITIPEKVGEGILSYFRSDLSGTIWRQLGTRVFFVVDSGTGLDARDEIRFLSTVEPTPLEEAAGNGNIQVASLRSITALAYFLKPNQPIDGVATFTLYRKEIVDFVDENPLDGRGKSFEVFDKLAYLNIECYDAYDSRWVPSWDSETMIREEQLDLEAADAANEGIARVGDRTDRADRQSPASATPADPTAAKTARARGASRREQNLLTQSAPGADPTLNPAEEVEMLPPAAVPSAVRVEIGIYAGQGNRIERDSQGQPIVRTYATIVPILTSQRVKLPGEEGAEEGLGGVAGGPGSENDPDGIIGGLTPPPGEGATGARGAPRGGSGTKGPPPRAGRGGKATPRAGAPIPNLPGLPGRP